jgi:hypothetical protein
MVTVLPSARTPRTRSPTLSGAAMSACSVVSRTILVLVVDDLGVARCGDGSDDAAAAQEAVQARHLVAERRHRVQAAGRLIEQEDGAIGRDDQVTCLLQREVRHALDVEQRRQLLGEAVDQVDLAIEVQDLGAERLAFDLLRDQMVEQRRDRPGARRSRHPPELLLGVRDREARARARVLSLTVQQATGGILDAHRHAQCVRQGGHQRAGALLPADDVTQRDAAHCIHRPRTSRAFCSSASGSNGLVM